MTVRAAPAGHRERLVEPTTGTLGMLLLILTEAALFATFIVSYFFLRFQASPTWPPAGIDPPDLFLPSVMTVVLLSSSVPMHLADTGIRRGSRSRLRVGLLVSFVLGSAFLGLQGVEYSQALLEFGPGANAYGSMFFTITGFHGAHVAGGLLLNLWCQVRAAQGSYGLGRHATVRNVALYWHFVDAVWIAIFASLYLATAW
jgi:heme/copper-type cytochrome/quinol oxidase subunit 3